eukprot:TRINITY_DN48852_c0_g1_i1.p1 TRINITY_DN48852_c0_g1~~TRINITY_DN48852_c0_g1_i1.p1  ORF type:complete len:931 (-),score=128.29 TRINITY_DN48852_c0_g1_i1:121-2913(-)
MGTPPSMRDLVRSLVFAELAVTKEDLEDEDERGGGPVSDTVADIFLRVFQRVSLTAARRNSPGGPAAPAGLTGAGGNEGDEDGISDLISAHLIQRGERDARGVEKHMRFHGLTRRMRAHNMLQQRELRSAVLQALYLLRDGGSASSSGASNLPPRFASSETPIDVFPLGGDSGVGMELTRQGRSSAGFGGTTGRRGGLVGSVLAGMAPASATGATDSPQIQSLSLPKLAWHVPAGGPAVDLPESQLLRDLLHALQGVNSSCFKYHQSERRFELNSSFVLSRPVWHLVHYVLELGGLHMRLCTATNAALEMETPQSLLHQALCEAVREQLRDYYKTLALLMTKVEAIPRAGGAGSVAAGNPNGGELTLRKLWTWIQRPLEQARLLASLTEACGPLRGGALASAVHVGSRVGDGAARQLFGAILRRVLEPLLAMIRAWMTEGELQDPFGEFFVCADASVPLEDLWTRMYSLEVEMVPCFVDLELARKIMLTGKSVNFIRLGCPGQRWLPGGGDGSIFGCGSRGCGHSAKDDQLMALPEAPRFADDFAVGLGDANSDELLPLAALTARVEQSALRTNRHLVSLMMDRYALGEHCLALRRFLLLGQGDFVESLMDIAEAELSRDAKDVHRHQLIGVVDMAVRQSNAQFCPVDTLQRLDVKILEPSAGERGWDVFLLDYAIDSPLHVVFTPAAMRQYHRAFSFLWKLRRVSHSLASCWRQHTALQRHLVSRSGALLGARSPELNLEMRQTLHKSTMLRNEMQHFVQNIHSYVMCEVIETSWAKLQASWQECSDLDQVILEHQRYLSCIEEGAFLAPRAEAILTGLGALFDLALEFAGLHESVVSSSFEAVEAMSSEPEGPLPFARSLAECRAQLDQIGAVFLVRLQALIRGLETQPTPRQLSSDLRFLVCQLDFNVYYEQRRTTLLTDGGPRTGS